MASKYLFLGFLIWKIILKVEAIEDSKSDNDCCWAGYLCDQENTTASWRCSQEGYVCCLKRFEEITCGKRFEPGFGFRIEGENDNNAVLSELPWMISIYKNISNKWQFQCAGSVIEDGIVLTAAHCVRESHTMYQARILELDSSTHTHLVDYQVNKVEAIIRHANFRRSNLTNDIALLLLEKSGFNLSIYDNINNTRICYDNLNDHMEIDENDCWIAGWGAKQRNKPKTLSRVQIPLVENKACLKRLRQTKLGKRHILPENVLCAGGVSGKDPSIGDGGGPLFCKILNTEDNYKQIGIISYGIREEIAVPKVYTDVSKYREWIATKIKTLNNVSQL